MRSKVIRLAGWGRFPVATGPVFRPERIGEVRACLSATGGSLLARGAGRSYGDQALNSAGSLVLMERLDRLLHFSSDGDPLLEAEAGVRLETLQNWLLGRGFMLPVTPGTGLVSVGGAIANDVHGKNHDADGSFGRHVAWIELLYADGRIERLTPEETPQEFWATVGGGGLTGIILAAGLKLLSVPGGAVSLCEQPIPDLAAFLNGLRAARKTSRFSVGWIDALARGDRLGRGILETADLSPAPFSCPGEPENKRVPLDVPGFCLSRPAVRLFNWGYYHRVPRFGRHRLRAIRDFLYPLDRIHDWNRLYGKSGFSQFQALLPEEAAESGLRALLATVSKGGAASFLAVLKTLGAEGSGFLAFPRPGFTLALDLPRRGDTAKLLARLEAITLDHDGRVYLAKDSALTAAAFARMYPRLSEFQSVAAKMDPKGRFSSDQARRLEIR